MGFGGSGGGITTGRETYVVFDRYLPVIVQPFFAFERTADKINRGSPNTSIFNPGTPSIEYIPKVGLRLAAHQTQAGAMFERSAAQAGQKRLTTHLTAASYVDEQAMFRQESYTGVTYSDSPSTGRYRLQKQVPSGSTWQNELSADATAFPSPFPGDDTVPLDRIIVGNTSHMPDEPLFFEFSVPGHLQTRRTSVATLYFGGPAGGDDTLLGDGLYAVKLLGDGSAVLYERGNTADDTGTKIWARRAIFQYATDVIAGRTYTIAIVSDASESCTTGFKGKSIIFRAQSYKNGGNALISSLVNTIETALASTLYDQNFGFFHYAIPTKVERTTQLEPLRIDARRDLRILLSIFGTTYETSAEISDDYFSLPLPACGDEDFTLEWYADSPAGCTVDCKLFDASTGAEVPDGTLTISDCLGGQRVYPTPTTKPQTFYVTIEFNGPGDKTPTLTRYKVFRSPVTEQPTVTETAIRIDRESGPALPRRMWSEISVTGPTDDINSSQASVTISELIPASNKLQVRAGHPVEIEVRDESSGSVVSVLHRGIVQRPDSTQIAGIVAGGSTTQYPYIGNFEVSMSITGEWHRVARRLMPERFTLWDQDAEKPMKVTAAIYQALKMCGYSASQIQIPDKPVRFFGTEQDQLVIEPHSPIADQIQTWLHDYLNAYLLWCPNSGTGGMWRFKQRPKPPYTHLAKFVKTHPGAKKDPAFLGSYATSPVQEIPVFSDHGTPSEMRWVEPAEATRVTVYGAAPSGTSTQGTALLTQTCVNLSTYNALVLSPSDPGYPDITNDPDALGEDVAIYVYDYSLQTQSAVNWVARRIFEMACYAREYVRVSGPLVFVNDTSDAMLVRNRPLRTGDPVQYVDDTGSTRTFIITQVNINFVKDEAQFATYEMVSSARIDSYGIPTAALSPLKLSQSWQARKNRQRSGIPADARMHFTSGRRVSLEFGNWVTLPGQLADPIQDMDNTSSTFGEFLFMMDYD